jgi:hypothetical protein
MTMKIFSSTTAKFLYAVLLALFLYARFQQQINTYFRPSPAADPQIPGSLPPAAGLQPAGLQTAPPGISRETSDWIGDAAREMRLQPAPHDTE